MYERTKLSFTNRTKLSFTALLASLQWQCSLSFPSATQTSSVISVFFRFFNWKRHVFHLSHKHSRRRSQKQKLVVFSIELSPLEMDDHSQVPSRNFKTRWSSEDFRFLHFPHLMPHKRNMMENWPKPHDVCPSRFNARHGVVWSTDQRHSNWSRQWRGQPKILGMAKCSIWGEYNTILCGTPHFKGQNDYIC